MKKYFIITLLVLSSCTTKPEEMAKVKTAQKTTAYKNALMNAPKDTVGTFCFYKTTGCDGQQPPAKLDYPKQGYMLDYDGKYTFKDNALSR